MLIILKKGGCNRENADHVNHVDLFGTLVPAVWGAQDPPPSLSPHKRNKD